jgi:hypothetical protein
VLWKVTCAVIALSLALDWALYASSVAFMGRILSGDVYLYTYRNLGRVSGMSRALAIVLFLVWFYAAAKRARTLRRTRLSVSPAWCVASFFVPFVNLYAPYKAMSAVAAALDPMHTGKAPRTVLIWWILFLAQYAGAAFTNKLGWMALPARTYLVIDAVEPALYTGAAVALFLVMRFIHDGQDYWARKAQARRKRRAAAPGA